MLRNEVRFWGVRVFLIVFSIFMINRIFFFSSTIAESTMSYLLYPAIVLQKMTVDPIYKYFHKSYKISQLRDQCQQLIEQNEQLQGQITQMIAQNQFSIQTKEIRKFAQRYNFSHQILSQVLLKNFDDRGHYYLVDAGSRDGITKNMVAVYKNNIVGRVIEVMPTYSKVALITDERCKVAAYCKKVKIEGIFQGNNNDYPTVEFVPHFHKVSVGDDVISIGNGLIFPQGFSLGKISDLYVDGVSYKITVQPFIDIKQLDYVYLILV